MTPPNKTGSDPIFELSKYIDIHTHILSGVDDGCATLQESVAMAKVFVRSGVTQVVATPHYLPGTAWAPSREHVLELVGELQQTLDARDIPLLVLPGMEVADNRKLEQRLAAGELLPLGDSGHYLIEPSFHGSQKLLLESLARLLEGGYRLILAHPERVAGLQEDVTDLKALVEQGLLVQITAGSLLGHFDSRVRDVALTLWLEGCCHFVASDAHTIDKRGPLSDDEWRTLQNDPHTRQILTSCNQHIGRIFSKPQDM